MKAYAVIMENHVNLPPSPSLSFDTLPQLNLASVPVNSTLQVHLPPKRLHDLGFRGYTIEGMEGILPPICSVPAGTFTMGGDKTYDSAVLDNETPQHLIEVGDFSIGQHPVTVAEYACAVRANAVRVPPPSRFAFILKSIDWAQQLKHPDHPVVCVSWNDAVAYTKWLAKLTGQPWRLPTEAEWEKAARGTDGRFFPWGNTPPMGLCNIADSGNGTTSAVDRYPKDKSHYHVRGMAGNVMDWVSSLPMPYPYRPDDGREDRDSTSHRVLRGGSWYDTANHARVTYRDGRRGPNFHGHNVGFRMALDVINQ